MKKWNQIVGFLAVAFAMALPAHAGEWELVGYQRDAKVHNENVVAYNGADDNQPFAVVSKVQTSGINVQNKAAEIDGGGPITSNPNKDHIGVSWNQRSYGPAPSGDPPVTPGVKKASGIAVITMRPVFRWKPSPLPESSIPDPDDKPTPLYVVESASILGTKSFDDHNGPVRRYSSSSPYSGSHFTFTDVKCPFKDSVGGKHFDSESISADGNRNYLISGQMISVIDNEGSTQAMGPSRTLSGSITLDATYGNQADLSGSGGASLFFNYSVSVCRFSLDVGVTGEFNRLLNELREKQVEAFANRALLTPWYIDQEDWTPKFWWNGPASYTANLSPSLLAAIGDPTYAWSIKGSSGNFDPANPSADDGLIDVSLLQQNPSQQELDESSGDASTAAKHLNHLLEIGKWPTEQYNTPRTTNVRVTVSGSKAAPETMKGKAKVDWYREPASMYRIEVTTTAIDLETGDERPVTLDASDDAIQWEEVIRAVDADKELLSTIHTGAQATQGVLDLVIEMVMPDAFDVVTSGLGAAHKLYKTGRGVVKFVEFTKKLEEVFNSKSATLLSAGRRALGRAANSNHPVVIKTTSQLIRTARDGKLPTNAQRTNEQFGRIKKTVCWIGQFCFVKGTKVVLADGSLKAIEEVKVGDLVLSKDEESGEVAAKKVTQTFVRQAPATLALTFSNGETIETTAEHPFFVQDKGFTPAGLVALGNSIVTRAGPGLQVTGIEKKRATQTVYNFSVADFHTYFIGKFALWTHNTRCTAFGTALQEADEIVSNWRHLYPNARQPGVACGMELPDGRLFSGFSARPEKWAALPNSQIPPWSVNKAVDDLYKDISIVPSGNRSANHGYCAEAMALSRVFDVVGIGPGTSIEGMRAALSGVKSAAVDIDYTDGNHRHKAPCSSCEAVLRYLNIVF